MKKLIKSSILLLLCGFAGTLYAQESPSADRNKDKHENIIIRKKTNSNEKITIVIDGDKMTINGKPVDEFKSDDVEVIKKGDMDFAMAMPPMPPGREMFNEDFMREMSGNKAFLGVMTTETKEGAKITDVTDKSAAEKAGLKEDDIITKVGTDAVTGPNDLYKAIGKYKPNDKITVTYIHNGKESTATASLDEAKHMKVFNWNGGGDSDFNFTMPALPRIGGLEGFGMWNKKPHLGLQVQDTENGKGVKVLDADDESPAATAGLKEDDVITQVNGKAINSVDDLKESVKDIKDGDTIKVTYLRNGQTQNADVKFPKELKTIDL